MTQVMKEAEARDLHSVYAYVRVDNKVKEKDSMFQNHS